MRRIALAASLGVVLVLSVLVVVQAAPKKGALKLSSADIGMEIELTSGRIIGVSPGKEVALPPATYTIKSLSIVAKDKGRIWKLKSTAALGQLRTFTITEGETTTLDVGTPLQLQTLAMKQKDGQTISIGVAVVGKSQEMYSPGAFLGSDQAPAPKFKIVNQAGQTLAAGQLEYG
jgi:hypothetical protein